MAFVKDPVNFVKEIGRGRDNKNQQLVVSADKGCKKVIITITIYDADSNGKVHGLKPGSNQRIFLLAMVNYFLSYYLILKIICRLMISQNRRII